MEGEKYQEEEEPISLRNQVGFRCQRMEQNETVPGSQPPNKVRVCNEESAG